jgi:prevent-host-death family protein
MVAKNKLTVIQITRLHRQLGQIIRAVALSDEHVVIEKGGLPVAVMMSMNEYDRLIADRRLREHERLARSLGQAAARAGLTEAQLLAELEADRQAVYRERYGQSRD